MATASISASLGSLAGITEGVVRALEDPRYRWRTIRGLAKEMGLPDSTIRQAIFSIPADDLVETPSRKGQLFTTRRHYRETQTLKSRLLSVISDMPK